MKVNHDNAEVLAFASAVIFESWLANNYQQHQGVWIKMAKVSSGIPSITSDEAVDVGLCWGWISGQRKSYDQTYYLQKYVPRRTRSIWSQVNVDKVAVLTAAGKMRAPGLTEVAAAKTDGRWEIAYASQRNVTLPPDLLEALAQNDKAKAYFDQLNKTERYAVILQLLIARTDKSRANQLNKLVTGLAAGTKIL